ncbi:MAG: hypothetical protein AABY88_01125 [Pseudomonadota bacterium]
MNTITIPSFHSQKDKCGKCQKRVLISQNSCGTFKSFCEETPCPVNDKHRTSWNFAAGDEMPDIGITIEEVEDNVLPEN